jgi:hypothetical protein
MSIPFALPFGARGGDDDGAKVGDDDASFDDPAPPPKPRSAWRIRLALFTFFSWVVGLAPFGPLTLSTLLAKGLLPPLTVVSSSLVSRLWPEEGESALGRNDC